MYLKLTLRNARRSALDYLLYIFTLVVLMTIMSFSNCISEFADGIGFQAVALPVLIVIIMSVLVNFVNAYMIKQRANEFATYMLLGIEKHKLIFMFLCELMLIGLFCYLAGTMVGIGLFSCYYIGYLSSGEVSLLKVILNSSFMSFVYFLLMELLSLLLMKRKIYRLQIVDLIREKRLNQPLKADKMRLYGTTLTVCFVVYLILLLGIFSDNKTMSTLSISFVMVPLLVCVFAFFKWLYCCLGATRLSRSDFLYSGNRLYWIADTTSNSRTSANLNAVFCIAMLFSEMSFVAGEFMLTTDILFITEQVQRYMGFLQISICVIFIVIYFSVLSLSQIMQLKKEVRNVELLFAIGKTRSEIKALVCLKSLAKLLFPALISFIVLGSAVPLVNYKLNLITSYASHDIILKALGWFAVCFAVLYVCYFVIIFVYISKALSVERR